MTRPPARLATISSSRWRSWARAVAAQNNAMPASTSEMTSCGNALGDLLLALMNPQSQIRLLSKSFGPAAEALRIPFRHGGSGQLGMREKGVERSAIIIAAVAN